MSNTKMAANDELGRVWNKTATVYFKVIQYLSNCTELK
jgi:hypothetical protein